jgi:cytochrome c-type biogenesis protein CcsB
MTGFYNSIYNLAFAAFFASGLVYILYFNNQRKKWLGGGVVLAMSGFFCLTAVLVMRVLAANGFSVFGLYESLLFFSWLIMILYLFVERKANNSVNAIFVLPLVVVLLSFAKFFDSSVRPLPPALKSYWLGIHVTFCFLGYACFVLGFCFAVLYLWQEREIKSRKVDRFFFRLPSLGLLDSLGYRTIAYGFCFLSLGIISGSVWAQRAWGSFWSWDPKETLSLILWLVYLIYLHGRLTQGWKGRRCAFLAIAGFIVMLFTYLGVSFILPGLHSYL